LQTVRKLQIYTLIFEQKDDKIKILLV